MAFYPLSDLQDWAGAALMSVGVPEEDAACTARLLVRSDARGISTHGLARLTSYVQRLRDREFNPSPDVRFTGGATFLQVDADGALGQLIGLQLIKRAVQQCRQSPLLWVSVRNVGHLGALGIIALEAAEAGLICFLGQRTPPILSLEGFSAPGIGHNPFAFGAPSSDGQHLIVDMACSVAARGQILLAARENEQIPATWALDVDGKRTTDAVAATKGSLLPFGDYKGMGIAMIIECLSAGLSVDEEFLENTAMVLPEKGAVSRESAFFLFINPELANTSGAYFRYMQHWMHHYEQAAGEASRIPGSRGHALEAQAQAEGLTLSVGIEQELRRLGDALGLPFCRNR
jgi:LDH2 family malate/lactate/ureidoglycolate dehydrogenase